jgi:hypothetical protein
VTNGSNIDLVSVVGVFDPSRLTSPFLLTAQHIRQIESSVGESAQGGEGVTERGAAKFVQIPRRQMDLVIENERIEVRRRYPGTPLEEAARGMTQLFSLFLEAQSTTPDAVPLVRTGYNYILTRQMDRIAIAKLAEGLFSRRYLSKLKHPVKGAATWIWLDAGEALLWLRLEPYRNDPAATKVAVNANFVEEGGVLVNEAAMNSKLTGYFANLNDLLDRIGL